ncbi:4'-phosphopantetheinyl transferase family protein [Streptomyces boninensis]|uniref:4'-phosphopantetheinyl transferase family protein n=1 Tax=Streptomyces boninensis TaxID=2039455 RepID=UPI003B212BF1
MQALASRLLVRAVLARGTGQPCVNVSHDTGLLALVAAAVPCGIDVEDIAEQRLREVADRFCRAEDAAVLDGPGGARQLWTAKESAAKALGLGLRAGLSSIHFTRHPGRHWAGAVWRGRPTGLRTRTVDLGSRHLAVTAGAVPDGIRLTWWAPRRAAGTWGLNPAAPSLRIDGMQHIRRAVTG